MYLFINYIYKLKLINDAEMAQFFVEFNYIVYDTGYMTITIFISILKFGSIYMLVHLL